MHLSMHHTVRLPLARLTLCLLLLGGCISLTASTTIDGASTQPVKLKVLVLPFLSFARFFIAADNVHIELMKQYLSWPTVQPS